MSANSARVTGRIVGFDVRSGVSGKTGEPYTIVTAAVMNTDAPLLVDVNVPRDHSFTKDQDVDWLVDLSTFGTQVQMRYTREFPSAVRTGAATPVKAVA